MQIAIIGAGMAGLACADRLRDGGFRIAVFEKSRGTGGRLATRRSEHGGFDHGAQFATARDKAFITYLKRARKAGQAAIWKQASSGPDDWWTGKPGMSGLVKPLAAGLDVRTGQQVTALVPREGGWSLRFKDRESDRFDAVLLAIPVDQAIDLLGEYGAGFPGLKDVVLEPCWTALFAFAKTLAIKADVIQRQGDLAWAVREGARPGRGGRPERWVVQATADWSRDNLELYGAAAMEALLDMLAGQAQQPLPKLIHADAHRWRYAKVARPLGQDCLWNAGLGLGLAGDWCLAARVEAAFLSGRALAEAVMETHGR